MKLVDNDRPQICEHLRGVRIAEQQAQRFRGGKQHLRRLDPLPRLAVGRRVAGAGLDADRQAHLLDRADQVALNVDRERLQRRDIERVQPVRWILGKLADRRQEARERLARAGRRNEQRASPAPSQLQHLQLVAAGSQPLESNHCRTTAGSAGPLRGRQFLRAAAALPRGTGRACRPRWCC